MAVVNRKYADELETFRSYLKSNETENAKRHLLFPLFKKIYGEKLKSESAACGADAYIDGQIIIECKTDAAQWLDGFYQALHYQRKFGLAYHTVIVLAHKFVAIWKLDKLPDYVTLISKTSNPHTSPNEIGKLNAKRTSPQIRREIQSNAFYWLSPKDLDLDIFTKNITVESYEILKILNNIQSDRIQIGTHSFINAIERLKPFFNNAIDAVHCFYTIINFWDITSKVIVDGNGEQLRILGYYGNKFSEPINILPRYIEDFKRFIETQYIFTNEGSGLTVDYYFSRFDEVLAIIDPEYVKQHGIFFTNNNLSKFALWFAQHHFPGDINNDYIVFDPAAGSGNLVSSWRGKLKHKIVSELQPDLLKTIERRMQADPYHLDMGFTIIPRTADGTGLNFLDKSGEDYLNILTNELLLKNVTIDKPLCFLVNPPYKNTDENTREREKTDAEYTLHPSIIELTGEDAGKERYLAFLAQILNICKKQYNDNNALQPMVMVFTPTSWLIPRSNYVGFRRNWDAHFIYHSGFAITSNEFFKLNGKWPLAFTIWKYKEAKNDNIVKLYDCTTWNKLSLALPYDDVGQTKFLETEINTLLKKTRKVTMDNSRGSIKDLVKQKQYAFKRDKTDLEKKSNGVIGGLPFKDKRRDNIKTYGKNETSYLGFMDNNTPVRVTFDKYNRTSKKPDRFWLQLRPTFIDINLTKIQTGPQDKYGYCAYDLNSSKITCTWFIITKILNGNYPIWANQYDIWPPNIKKNKEIIWYALSFAFVLCENRCVVTKFEANNPIPNAEEVFVDNPLSTTNKENFWNTTLLPFINENINADDGEAEKLCIDTVNAVTELYKFWNSNYTKGQFLFNVGLQDEPYFEYFDYADFLTPNSGIIQIKKYAENNMDVGLLNLFENISKYSKAIKNTMYKLLVEDFKYFS